MGVNMLSLLVRVPALLGISGVIWGLAVRYYQVSWPWALIAAVVPVVAVNWNSLEILLKTLPRDLRFLSSIIFELSKLRKYVKNGTTVSDVFQSQVLPKKSNQVAFHFENISWTFKQVEEYSNMVANYFMDQGYTKGDVVSIVMDSCPEMICLWFGLSKLGVVASLTNTNLRQEALVHCIKVSKSKSIIFGGNLAQAIFNIQEDFHENFVLYHFGTLSEDNLSSEVQSLDLEKLLKDCSTSPPVVRDPPTTLDELMYIFTSGTTGLPKACRVTHKRLMGGVAIAKLLGLNPADKTYVTMPMYHGAATFMGVGSVLIMGCSAALRKKFSASHFWEDCIRYDCTAVQYIGEIGRYLLAQPEKATDRQHKVRLALGNGLRKEVWKPFQERFNIKRIGEFYAATEGNIGMLTHPSSPVGSCGFITISLPVPRPIFIKVDQDTYKPLRDANGHCIVAKTGEIGELVGKISRDTPFDGYTNHEQSEKKILHNVIKHGDTFFSSGDIMKMDRYGNCFFVDRIGDTFRWKGENVSSTEVETILSKLFNLQCIVVYGVYIPGTEGKAGMAAISDSDGTFDPTMLESIKNHLPGYARPLFIRITKETELTETFKLKKVRLRQEGFDLSIISDVLYYLEPSSNKYKPLTPHIYSEIYCGNLKY